MKKKFINPDIKKLNPYIPPIFEKCGTRLYMNENIFGASPKCLEVLKNIKMEDFSFYPYGGDNYLKNIVQNKLGIKAENISFNHGAASSIQQVCMALLENNDKVLTPDPGWSYYKSVLTSVGAVSIPYELIINEKKIDYDIDLLIEKAKQSNAKMIILTSPNMPTGNIIKKNDIKRILENLQNTILVLDEVYSEFYNSEIKIDEFLNYKNFIDIRTFSKFYGLASLRIGYLLGHKDLIEEIDKISPLFGITYISQLVAGEALVDNQYYLNLKNEIISIRDTFINEINKLDKFFAYESNANFVLIDVKSHNPEKILNTLKNKGYLIRDCKGYGLNHHIRITIGLKEQMKDILNILKGI